MIDEEKTLILFGYKSTDLSKSSNKKVVAICENCKKPRLLRKVNAVESKLCAYCQKVAVSKKNAITNRLGRKLSLETRKKISQTHLLIAKKGAENPSFGKKMPPENRQKLIELSTGRIHTPATLEKMSKAKKGKKLSVATREKIKANAPKGKNHPRYGKTAAHGIGAWYQNKKGQRLWLRSSWEVKVALYLDNNNYNWEYEHNSFPITFYYKDILKEGLIVRIFYLGSLRGKNTGKSKVIGEMMRLQNIPHLLSNILKLKLL